MTKSATIVFENIFLLLTQKKSANQKLQKSASIIFCLQTKQVRSNHGYSRVDSTRSVPLDWSSYWAVHLLVGRVLNLLLLGLLSRVPLMLFRRSKRIKLSIGFFSCCLRGCFAIC